MSIRIEIGSYLCKFTRGSDDGYSRELEYRPNETVREVVEKLGIPIEEVGVITINGHPARMEHVLTNGDLVGLFAVALGG